uniref:Uncharacterized protein n=1 Tax=Nelumbo nucifera TaxID=4432 RepID=A0A822XYH0_NELNU|nr:TPA_asm: hypothetical protein HUJ06_026884 [Nelumbo nucifera]
MLLQRVAAEFKSGDETGEVNEREREREAGGGGGYRRYWLAESDTTPILVFPIATFVLI